MAPILPNGSGIWVAVGGWVAAMAILGLIIRSLRKQAPKGLPEMVSEFRKTWEREWKRFPLHADLPRLSRKVFIHRLDEKIMSPPEDTVRAVKQLIVGLAGQLYDDESSTQRSLAIETKFDQAFDGHDENSSDIQSSVLHFIIENEKLLGPALIGLLKTITQDIVAPGVTKMKVGLHGRLQYKDIRGEWFIHVTFHEDSVLVSHRKREQSFGHEQDQSFEFQWNLDLLFDADVESLVASSLYIPILEFNPLASEKTKSQVQLLLDDYLRV